MPEATELPEKAQWYADAFAENANWGSLHPYDWSRFYDFVIHCSRHCRNLRYDEIRAHFLRRGMPERLAEELANVYEHGFQMLLRARYCVQPSLARLKGESSSPPAVRLLISQTKEDRRLLTRSGPRR